MTDTAPGGWQRPPQAREASPPPFSSGSSIRSLPLHRDAEPTTQPSAVARGADDTSSSSSSSSHSAPTSSTASNGKQAKNDSDDGKGDRESALPTRALVSDAAAAVAVVDKGEGMGGGAVEKGTTEEYGYEEKKEIEGEAKYSRLSWQRLTICLIVEAIALGSLSMPKTFATVGLIPGILLTVGLGLFAIYTSWIVGQVCLRYPNVHHVDAIGGLLGARVGLGVRAGTEIMAAMFVTSLIFVTGSHVLTGTQLFMALSDNATCALAFGVVSAVVLYLLALPPTFHEMAILGYVDFASIVAAIIVTMVGVGLTTAKPETPQQFGEWYLFPKEKVSFGSAFLSCTNIIFAYSFALCQPSFMSEMARPKDYVKSIWALGLIEIVIYTTTGAVVFVLGGADVASPAIGSAGSLLKVAWGVAIPVVFISGAINTQVAARYVHHRIFRHSVHRYINTVKGWSWWLGLVLVGTVVAWVIAEAVPFFSDLLGLISALFMSGFSFYWPGFSWWLLLKPRGVPGWWRDRRQLAHAVLSACAVVIGLVTMVAGLYATISDIRKSYQEGKVSSPFTCSPTAG